MQRPVVLTIAGSDPSGGAGIQADLKTFAAHGVYGTSAVTLLTVQNTRGVQRVHTLEPDLVAAQIRCVLEDLPVRAVKSGALGTAPIIRAVAATLRKAKLPLIVDPVMVSQSGQTLLEPEAVTALSEELLPLASLITPNLPEARALARIHGSLALPAPTLLKDGHGTGDTVNDTLELNGMQETFTYPRLNTRHTHGTGCTLSAAITARLARGDALVDAVRHARSYLHAALEQAPGLGAGHGPLEHFPEGVLGDEALLYREKP